MNTRRSFTAVLLACMAAVTIGMIGTATASAAPPDPCHTAHCATNPHH